MNNNSPTEEIITPPQISKTINNCNKEGVSRPEIKYNINNGTGVMALIIWIYPKDMY